MFYYREANIGITNCYFNYGLRNLNTELLTIGLIIAALRAES